ncbi:NAD(P)-dependent oxidoreductase [Phaeacidiphilus oryzae]|uniref:NAD(P)-dependent oxidoreductase n=1 Tax=Phaeacidiphilus oryzae TaxID=348818 RepID=UPI000563371B|nr:NAD(P)-binding oxidoreductase [Phaeacidiphilus oryzae]
MRIAVLGASGKVGRLLVGQALERGHEVVALVRKPEQFALPSAAAPERLEIRRADVMAPGDLPALGDVEAAVSAIGISKGDGPGALEAGARLLAAGDFRTVWLGALGTGVSANAGGRIYQAIMKMVVGKEMAERVEADTIVLQAGGTVFHAPDLRVGGIAPQRRVLPLAEFKRPLLPPHVSRATLVELILDEAEGKNGGHGGEIVVPLG